MVHSPHQPAVAAPGARRRFALVGAGAIAPIHADAIRAISGATLVAVFGRSRDHAEAFGRRYEIPWYTDYAQLLEHEDVDIVDICTPSGTHAEFCVAAARTGRHVIVEKPIDVTLARADRMIATCRTHRVKLAIIFQSRFMSAYKHLRAVVEEGRLGRLILGDACVKWYRPPAYYASAAWRGTWELDGGGALINQSIHMVDLLQWIMGPVEAVSAFTDTLAHEGLEVEDTAVAALRFRSRALGTIEAGTSVYPGFPRRLEIHGERGSVLIAGDRIRAWEVPGTSEEERQQVAAFIGPPAGSGVADPRLATSVDHQAQLEDFLMAIEHGREPLVDGEEGRKSLEIVLAVYQSARAQRIIPLPLAGGEGEGHVWCERVSGRKT